ncbi:hypothetical protein PUN28_018420 [Cardiocondyla obscurior]|uniref:Uncharacterized protein n=1 Tax=Cardiocondyla obscurior TaxID=286306 RepID=A0AAW2EGH0_9HYME
MASVQEWIESQDLLRYVLRPKKCSIEESDIKVQCDVDSFVFCCRSLAPFRCHTVTKIHSLPSTVQECKNKKLSYLKNRDIFETFQSPPVAINEICKKNIKFYETHIATINNQSVFALIQLSSKSQLLKNRKEESESSNVAFCFKMLILKIFATAARNLASNTKTVGGSLAALQHVADKTYTIFQKDFNRYCACMNRELFCCNLDEKCGVQLLRFYICIYGLRLLPSVAQDYMWRLINLNHDKVDVVQIHRANIVSSTNNDIILLKTARTDTPGLREILKHNSTRLFGKFNKYCLGLLWEYGHFDVNAVPNADCDVTFMQGYSSSAKMTRCKYSNIVGIFCLLNGNSLQYLIDLLTYYETCIIENYELRLEEVVTLDSLRLNDSIGNYIQRYDMFGDEKSFTILLRIIEENNILYRIKSISWTAYCDYIIADDVAKLKNLYDETTIREPKNLKPFWQSANEIRNVISDFRLSYFMHGSSAKYNYIVTKNLFLFNSEAASEMNGIVQLRLFNDVTDTCDYSFYTDIMSAFYTKAVKHVWYGVNSITEFASIIFGDDNEKEDKEMIVPFKKCAAFMLSMYDTWSKNSIQYTDNKNTAMIFPEEEFKTSYQNIITSFTKKGFLTYISDLPKLSAKRIIVSKKSVTLTDLTKSILNPNTPFGKIVRMTIRTVDEKKLYNSIVWFLDNYVNIFPIGCNLYGATDKTWCIVESKATKKCV